MPSLANPSSVSIKQNRFGWWWSVDNGRGLATSGSTKTLWGAARQSRRALRRIAHISSRGES